MKYPEEANLERQKAHWWLPGAGEKGDEETFKGYGVSFGNDENVLKLDRGHGCTTF